MVSEKQRALDLLYSTSEAGKPKKPSPQEIWRDMVFAGANRFHQESHSEKEKQKILKTLDEIIENEQAKIENRKSASAGVGDRLLFD